MRLKEVNLAIPVVSTAQADGTLLHALSRLLLRYPPKGKAGPRTSVLGRLQQSLPGEVDDSGSASSAPDQTSHPSTLSIILQ